jgi:hypothetical protein
MGYIHYNERVHGDWPVRWPAEWRDPGALELVKDTPLGCLLFPSAEGFQNIIERARREGFTICEGASLPARVEMAKGEWPGVRMARGHGDASSGPTGAPWIDSNGWLVRLTRAQKPGCQVWIAADPPQSTEIKRLPQHLVAVADGAAHGGRWVISLDKGMAEGLAAGKPEFADHWKRMMGAPAFFEEHREWSAWPADAVLGIVSSFSGDNEFFSHEVLNLAARTDVSYSILEKGSLKPEALRGLRAVLYPDSDAPSAELRRTILDFVERGGLLIAGPQWGEAPGTRAKDDEHPRYAILRYGKGRIAMAHKDPDDPYQLAQDAQILVSHRYDLVRFFNGFALGSYFTWSPDRKRALVHAINYLGGAGGDPVTAHIAGRFRSAKLWSFAHAGAQPLEMAVRKEAVEVYLPRLPVYGGIELEV